MSRIENFLDLNKSTWLMGIATAFYMISAVLSLIDGNIAIVPYKIALMIFCAASVFNNNFITILSNENKYLYELALSLNRKLHETIS